MLERLENFLNTFLYEYSIAGLGIFRDWIVQKAQVDPARGKTCYFYTEWALSESSDNDEPVPFLRVEYLQSAEFSRLLKYMNAETELLESAQLGKIALNEAFVLNELVPEFMAEIEATARKNPESLRMYQKYSRDRMECNLLNAIAYFSSALLHHMEHIFMPDFSMERKALDYLLKDLLEEVEDYLKAISLTKPGEKISHKEIYHNVLKLNDALNVWNDNHGCMITNFDGLQEFRQLMKALVLFIKSSQVETHTKIKGFFNDLDSWLTQYGISIQESDVLGQILLKMANISDMPVYCKFACEYSRVTFSFIDFRKIKTGNFENILNLFHNFGDETAYISYEKMGKKEIYHYENGKEAGQNHSIQSMHAYPSLSYDINLSGEILANHLSEIKKIIETLSVEEPTLFKSWQKQDGIFSGKKKVESSKNNPVFFRDANENTHLVKVPVQKSDESWCQIL